MEQRNIIKWSEYSEYTELTIPSGEIWMSESELVDLFGVFIPKLSNAIKALYKEELVKPYEAERTIKKRDNLYVTVYNMEVVLLLAFRLNTYQTRAVRRELMERIERNHKPFEIVLTAIHTSLRSGSILSIRLLQSFYGRMDVNNCSSEKIMFTMNIARCLLSYSKDFKLLANTY